MTDNSEAIAAALTSPLVAYRWKDRGRAPVGYLKGMAVAFATTYRQLLAKSELALALTVDVGTDADRDGLRIYADELSEAGATSSDRANVLIQVFTLLLGLGMRESSGLHCEGRDLSAQNTSAETAEAGLFQVSYDSLGSHPLLEPLVTSFDGRNDLQEIFDDGATCAASSWRNWGEGEGREFQALTKQCPLFAAQYAGLLLRVRPRHWGPLRLKTAEVPQAAVNLFRKVRTIVDSESAARELAADSAGSSLVADLKEHLDFLPFVDPAADGASVVERAKDQYLVTLRGQEGGQLLLRRVNGSVELVASDNVLDFAVPFAVGVPCAGECSAAQYAIVAQAMVAGVDHFSSAAGPDHGNLACMWAVRLLVHNALGFWITTTDGTANFYPQLVGCFSGDRPLDTIPDGGIVISPTRRGVVGHVGLLGAGSGDNRLIYSNSSRFAMWKQNYTVGTWRARYAGLKKLPVYFFPLPRF